MAIRRNTRHIRVMSSLGRRFRQLALFLVWVLAGCGEKPIEVVEPVDFNELADYARRAQMAYRSEADIRAAYPGTVHVGTPGSTEVLYFVENFPEDRRQFISVRGTDNVKNVLQDADYLRVVDTRLGIPVHRGFDADTRAVLDDLRPHLQRDYTIYLTGHSLGAAISTLLMMYLDTEGYRVEKSINFGQPKLTNESGAQTFAGLNLLRVVDANDVVPVLPTATPLDSIGGIYTHLGPQLLLLDGPYYAYLDQAQAMAESRGSFWKDLGEESVTAHSISHYLARIEAKGDAGIEVAYAERESYLDPATAPEMNGPPTAPDPD